LRENKGRLHNATEDIETATDSYLGHHQDYVVILGLPALWIWSHGACILHILWGKPRILFAFPDDPHGVFHVSVRCTWIVRVQFHLFVSPFISYTRAFLHICSCCCAFILFAVPPRSYTIQMPSRSYTLRNPHPRPIRIYEGTLAVHHRMSERTLVVHLQAL